jgi:hypothetical protein
LCGDGDGTHVCNLGLSSTVQQNILRLQIPAATTLFRTPSHRSLLPVISLSEVPQLRTHVRLRKAATSVLVGPPLNPRIKYQLVSLSEVPQFRTHVRVRKAATSVLVGPPLNPLIKYQLVGSTPLTPQPRLRPSLPPYTGNHLSRPTELVVVPR